MTPLTLAEIRATIIDATPAMTAALLRDLDWMIRDGFDVRPAPAEGLREALLRAIGNLSSVQSRGIGGGYTVDLFEVEDAIRAALADLAPRVSDECVGCLAESDEPHRPACRYASAEPIPCPLCPHHMHLHDPEGHCGGGCH